MMLHTNHKSSSPYGLGEEDILSFFFLLVATEFISLKYFRSASPKDPFCEVSLKSVCQFQRRRFFK